MIAKLLLKWRNRQTRRKIAWHLKIYYNGDFYELDEIDTVPLLFCDAIEILLSTKEQFTTGDGGRSTETVVELVSCEDCGYVIVTENQCCPIEVCDIHAVGSAYWRGVHIADSIEAKWATLILASLSVYA